MCGQARLLGRLVIRSVIDRRPPPQPRPTSSSTGSEPVGTAAGVVSGWNRAALLTAALSVRGAVVIAMLRPRAAPVWQPDRRALGPLRAA